MNDDDWQQQFEAIWAQREETEYPRRFGPPTRDDILALTPEAFGAAGEAGIDPRWLHHGVFEFPPTPTRASWAYVSSGLSNPWHDDEFTPDGDSGLGMEFVFETPRAAPWALHHVAQLVAFQLLVAAGRYGERDLVDAWDRLPPRTALDGVDSLLTAMIIVPAQKIESPIRLPSGKVDLLHVVGITPDEHAFAKEHGTHVLLEALLKAGAAPIMDPARKSVL
jgi:Suppressor of fused protein (SUFU)